MDDFPCNGCIFTLIISIPRCWCSDRISYLCTHIWGLRRGRVPERRQRAPVGLQPACGRTRPPSRIESLCPHTPPPCNPPKKTSPCAFLFSASYLPFYFRSIFYDLMLQKRGTWRQMEIYLKHLQQSNNSTHQCKFVLHEQKSRNLFSIIAQCFYIPSAPRMQQKYFYSSFQQLLALHTFLFFSLISLNTFLKHRCRCSSAQIQLWFITA